MAGGIQVLAKAPSGAEGIPSPEVLDSLVDSSGFVEFLTFPAYRYLY